MEFNNTFQKLFEEIEKALGDLDLLRKRDIVKDQICFRAARDATFSLVQSSIDIAARIISVEGLRKPETYRDVFDVLKESGTISPELADEMKKLVGLRNILAHVYWKLDIEVLLKFINDDCKHAREFSDEILRLMEERSGSHGST